MNRQGRRTGEDARLRKRAGQFLKLLRANAGLTQRDLADAVGVKYYTMISQIESGGTRIPPNMVPKYAKALRVNETKFALELMKFYDPHTYKSIRSAVEITDETTNGEDCKTG
jgi:transcriptional regulator with XRE-family HTH domain